MANAAMGLNEPRIAEAMVKLIRMARNDWRKPRLTPSKGASMALSNALPDVVRRMISGNLMATKAPCSGARQ